MIRFLTDSSNWKFGDGGESGEAEGEVNGCLRWKPRASPEAERLKWGTFETQLGLQRVGAKGRFMTDDAR